MPSRKKFKLGEVVQLNSSSSPRMTVVGYSEDGCVECCWGESERLKRTNFPPQALIAVRDTAESKHLEQIQNTLQRVYGNAKA